jgi:hypothetical protein
VLVVDEFLLELAVLVVGLFFEIVGKLHSSLPLFFSLLLLGYGKLVISEFPELGEFFLLFLCAEDLPLLSDQLILPGLFNGCLHFKSPLLLLLE